jgi:hypothetical protein
VVTRVGITIKINDRVSRLIDSMTIFFINIVEILFNVNGFPK